MLLLFGLYIQNKISLWKVSVRMGSFPNWSSLDYFIIG